MAIDQDRVADVKVAVAFTDDLRAAYLQLQAMQTKIQRYIDGVAAVAGETATPREAKFVEIVQMLVSAKDLARVGALLPTLAAFVAELEADYSDFLAD